MYALSQRNVVSKPCPGVLINDVCWARSNVDKPGTFVTTPEADGMYYQWNRKKGWPAEKPGMEWYTAGTSGERWEIENDPCPKGWRVPTAEEMKISLNSGEVANTYTQRNGVKGVEFTYMSTRAAVFFPFSNLITYEGPNPTGVGMYWSGSSSGNDFAECLTLGRYNQVVLFTSYIKNQSALTIRCVADKNVPTCADVVTDTYVTVCAKDLPYKWGDKTFDVGTQSGVYRFQYISTTTGCDSIVNLHLTVQSESEKPCPGVLINGVCWAEYNVAEPGRFANPGNAYGMLYQWNRRKGWPAMTPDSVSGWDSSLEPGDTWAPANDPCPIGWRMPTVEELKSLFDETKVNRIETGWDRVLATRYTDMASGNMVFFPHANYRKEHGATNNSHPKKEYWANSNHWALWDDIIFRQMPYACGFSVRCVADEQACDIVLTASETICKEALPYTWHDTTFREGTATGEYCIRRTNPANDCDSIFYLYLTVDTLCGKPCKERGVLINGVCWAESNVDNPNTFASTPEAFGLLYQWNWKKGHPLKGDIDLDDWSHNFDSPRWETVNNPCPADWRIPTSGEVYTLLDDLKVTYEWTQQNGVNGMKFIDKFNGNTIFMPAAGHRFYPFDYASDYAGGYYWSTTRNNNSASVYSLYFGQELLIFSLSVDGASSVRCVAGRDTTGCSPIVTATSATVCARDFPYPWGDTIFEVGTQSGVYRFQHISTVTGCDSIVNLHLTVHASDTSFFDGVCFGSAYSNYGFHLPVVYRDTVIHDTLQSVFGCDSVRALHLTVNPKYNIPLYDTVCQGDAYTQHGFSLSNLQTDGVHTLSFASQAGCDSILTLYLTVHPVYDTVLHDTICQGDSYNNHGFSLPSGTSGGTFTESYSTIYGCDSTVTLNLFVCPSYLFSESKDICEGDTFNFRGHNLSQSGVYDDTLKSIHGCDSIHRLFLTVHSTAPFYFPDEVCYGSSYDNHGFHLPAVYRDTVVR
ncbi:MAG: fibrobacter succinogenes major paralogous domain-containing protein, partial [Oscillibacter sp.]|nr:fibrobacter succinogenes major paralogous domain-containing protein [Oscillibacter sp.]